MSCGWKKPTFQDGVSILATATWLIRSPVATSIAKKNGSAVAIGHPFPETLDVLEEYIPQLKAAGIKLLPVSQLIQQQQLIAQTKQKNKWNNSKSLTQSESAVHLKKSIN